MAEPGGQGQPVVAVVFNQTAGHCKDAVLDAASAFAQVDFGAVAGPDRHGVQKAWLRSERAYGVGAFVDHREAEIFQHRHPGRKRNGIGAVIDVERQARRPFSPAAQPHGQRIVRAQRLEHGDIVQGIGVRVGHLIIGGKGACVIGDVAGMGRRRKQAVGKGAGQLGNFSFQRLAVGARGGAAIAPDDEMHPGQIAFGEVGGKGRDAPVIAVGEMFADPGADIGIEAVARQVNENGNEIIEPVDARQNPHARPVGQGGDHIGEFEKLVLGNLEQLVARVIVQRVHQRLSGVRARIKARLRHHLGYLAPDQRYLTARSGQRGGCEEPQYAQFAGDRAVCVEGLDAHIVHMHAPVYKRAPIGLGDHERLVGIQKRQMLIVHVHISRALAQIEIIGLAQYAQPRSIERNEGLLPALPGQPVLAHAQEGEIVVGQPGKKMDRLGQRLFAHGRRVRPIGDHCRAQTLEHLAPVDNRGAHLRHGLGQFLGNDRK